MRSIFLIFVSGCCLGCGLTDDPDMRELKSSLRITGEEVTAKQDESIVILRENTNALAAIKSQVESLASETREATDTLKASLVDSESVRKEDDQQSALEPQEQTRPNLSQPIKPVASAPAVRLSGPLKLSWNVEGNWNPTILETAKHLREDHGIIADGMSHQQMHDAHAAAHEGRPVAIKSPTVQFVNRGTSCPGGVCPTRQSVRMRWRR
jgi:hypothetical protein